MTSSWLIVASLVAVMLLSLLGSVVIYVGLWWMLNPWAQTFTVAAGIMCFGAASAISAGVREGV